MNITYLHGEPAPRKELEPFDVVQGSFHAQLYDINSLLDLPLANVRKLWKSCFQPHGKMRNPLIRCGAGCPAPPKMRQRIYGLQKTL